MPSPPTAPIVAASLAGGFAVAQKTGIRPLGGAVCAAACAWCARRWARRAGAPTAAALIAVYAGGLAGSHPLAKRIGAWPAVSTVAAVSGAAAWALADRRA